MRFIKSIFLLGSFLFFVAKQLAKELGLYPEVSNQVVTQE
jgi:uncharacterized 2Fe-2S/4Fe-4S cluster protein (DUF4445 family)